MVAAGLASLDRRRNVPSAAAGVMRLNRWRRWLQVLADGVRVGCYPPRVNRESVAALVVCVQDNKQESAQDNVCSVGVLRLLSMRRANICNSMAVPLYALRLYVTSCIYGGIYGRAYNVVLFAHGIGGHNGRSIIRALLLHALVVCQRACNIGLRGK